MAQVFNNAVVTDAGVNLIAACEAAGDPIVFTRVVTGDGVHTDKTPAALKVRTALINQKQSVSLSSKRAVANACKITAVISNVTLVTGYYMNELGLYAQQGSDSSTEVLFNIAVVAASQGDWFPPYNGTSPAEIVQSFVISSANDLVVQIALESDSFALKSELGDLDDLDTSDKDNIVKAINSIADKFDADDGTLKVQYGGTWSDNTGKALQTLGAQASRAITEVINQPDTLLIPVNGGRYFGHQNKLYRASEGKIAAGSTITPEGVGKNCEEVELSSEIARKASIKSITDNVEHEFKCTAADGYDTGDHVYIECADQRYVVTAPIAYNESMTVGSNIDKASVDDDLSSISSDLTNKEIRACVVEYTGISSGSSYYQYITQNALTDVQTKDALAQRVIGMSIAYFSGFGCMVTLMGDYNLTDRISRVAIGYPIGSSFPNASIKVLYMYSR